MMQPNKGKINSKRQLLMSVLGVILAVVVIIAVVLSYPSKNAVTPNSSEQMSTGESIISSEKEAFVSPINFKELKAVNPEIYAYIKIPDTKIEYPIVQRQGDNNYYLKYTIEGIKTTAASIFTEDHNSQNFTDFNSVIYGHNMINGSMFGSLKNYRNPEFFNAHKKIYIYTEQKTLVYTVFSAYYFSDRHLLLGYNLDTQSGIERYLSDIKEVRDIGAVNDATIFPNGQSNIITLSTCHESDDKKRFLVQGVLTEIED